MKKTLYFLILIILIIPALSACKKEIKNEEYDEYKIKATEVLNFNNVSSKTTFEIKKFKYKIVDNSSLYNKMKSDETKQEVYFDGTYTQFSELTFRIPLALGYAGNTYHKMDAFFGKVFKETAMTGDNQFVSTYKVDDYNYVTKMVASTHYIEVRFNYVDETQFWFEWISLKPTDYSVTTYYYGDSSKNLIGFGDTFAGIHISTESTGWTTSNQDTINYFKKNIEIDIDENEVNDAQLNLSNNDYITISDQEFSESLSIVLDKPITNNGVDIDGWRNLGKVDTVYSYDGNDTDTITIPTKYTKMYFDFAINSKVRKLVIPNTVTTIVDDNGMSVTFDDFIFRTSKYSNGEYHDYVLEEIVVEEGSPLFKTVEGNLFSKNGNKLLYIVDNPNAISIDLRCDELGESNFEAPRKYWSRIRNITVNLKSLPFLIDYVNYNRATTVLDSLTIYEWNDARLDISGDMFDLSLFKIDVLNIYGTFTEVFLNINENEFGEVNYYSTCEYSVSGSYYGLKELTITKDSTIESSGMIYYPDLEKIYIQEGVKNVHLGNISTEQKLEVFFPSTIENVYEMPLSNYGKEDKIAYVPSSYYWKNKLSDFPQIDYYYEESKSWTIKLNDYATEEEKYIVNGFKDVINNGESLTINNYYGEDTIVNIPSAINGIPVNYVYFDENFANQYYERYGEMASTNITELHIPLSIVSIGLNGNYHFEKVYYEGTKEQFPTTFYSWFDEAICSDGIIAGGEMIDNNTWTYEDTMVACEYNGLSFEFSDIKVNLKNDEYLISGYINGNEVTSYEYYAEKYNETRASFNILMHLAGIGDIKITFDFLVGDNLFLSIILLDEIKGDIILSEFYLSQTN